MADWNTPVLATAYSTYLTALKDRDFDAASHFYTALPTNPITGMLAYIRASNKWQQYNGSSWVDLALALAGGGTGASTAVDARTNLGLLGMAIQAASAVAITGGTISGLGSLGVSGIITGTGVIIMGSGAVQLTTAGGKIQAISSTYFDSLSGANLTGLSATQLTTGTVPDARFPSTLPALNGSLLTALNGSAISTGTVAVARLGSGSPSSTTFLRGDGTWASSGMRSIQLVTRENGVVAAGNYDITLSTTLTDYTKAFITGINGEVVSGVISAPKVSIISTTTVRIVAAIESYIGCNMYVVESY